MAQENESPEKSPDPRQHSDKSPVSGSHNDNPAPESRSKKGKRSGGKKKDPPYRQQQKKRSSPKKQGSQHKSKRASVPAGQQKARDKESGDRMPTRVMPDVHSKSILNITNLAIIAILIGLILFILRISAVFGIFIFSFIVAFLLWPLVEQLTIRKIPRVVAILIVYVVIGGALFGIGAAILPTVIAQGNIIFTQVPSWLDNVEVTVESMQTWLDTQGVREEDIQEYFNDILPTIQDWIINLGKKLATGLGSAVGWIVSLLIVPIIVFYLLLDAPRIHRGLIALAPRQTANEIQKLLNRLNEMLNGYLRGLLLLSCIMWLTTTIVLWIFGVKHYLLLGVLGGISEVIPIIGPIMALIPAMAVSFFTESDSGLFGWLSIDAGWVRALIIFAFYMILQYVEGNILVPKIMGSHLNLHPLTVLFALLAGGTIAGFLGILLSLPIAASLKVIFELYYPTFIQRVEDLVSRKPMPVEYLDE